MKKLTVDKFVRYTKIAAIALLVLLQIAAIVVPVYASNDLPILMPNMDATAQSVGGVFGRITGTTAVVLTVYLLAAIMFSIAQLVQGSLEGNPVTINFAKQALMASLVGEAAIGLVPMFVGLILRVTGASDGIRTFITGAAASASGH